MTNQLKKEWVNVDKLRLLDSQAEDSLMTGPSWVIDDQGNYLSKTSESQQPSDVMPFETYYFYFNGNGFTFRLRLKGKKADGVYISSLFDGPGDEYIKDIKPDLERFLSYDESYSTRNTLLNTIAIEIE